MKKYRPHEFAALVGRSTSTLRRWDAEGRLPARRTATNQRYYDDTDLPKVLRLPAEGVQKAVVVYCRVSSASQKADLASQITAMQTFCLGRGLAVDEWLSEIGGGLNFKRKVFLELFERIERREISTLAIAHKDRLTRFGFDYFEAFAQRHGCTLLVVNQEHLSPHEELVADMLAILHSFSSRLYGLRKYKKQLSSMTQEKEP
jgi:putative resolvase